MRSPPTITPDHLAQHALGDVRQSPPNQVVPHQASQRWPYALVERARALGWPQSEGMDDALGPRASAGPQRVGVKQLWATVVLGEGGSVVRTEVARLSRTDKDWCHGLALGQVGETFSGDAEPVSDLNLTAAPVSLGRKGTLRVMAASVRPSRLCQGQEPKAKR